MYRSFPQMWEGWTKNLALLFPKPRWLALWRAFEFVAIVAMVTFSIVSLASGDMITFAVAAAVAVQWLYLFGRRIARAHFDWAVKYSGVLWIAAFRGTFAQLQHLS